MTWDNGLFIGFGYPHFISDMRGLCWRIIQGLSGQPGEARRPRGFWAVAKEPRADTGEVQRGCGRDASAAGSCPALDTWTVGGPSPSRPVRSLPQPLHGSGRDASPPPSPSGREPFGALGHAPRRAEAGSGFLPSCTSFSAHTTDSRSGRTGP